MLSDEVDTVLAMGVLLMLLDQVGVSPELRVGVPV